MEFGPNWRLPQRWRGRRSPWPRYWRPVPCRAQQCRLVPRSPRRRRCASDRLSFIPLMDEQFAIQTGQILYLLPISFPIKGLVFGARVVLPVDVKFPDGWTERLRRGDTLVVRQNRDPLGC